MTHRNYPGIGFVCLSFVFVGGCATTKTNRVSLLEQSNQSLSGRLNQSSSDLSMATRERDELNARLVAALSEVQGLRVRLTEQPAVQETASGWTPVQGGAMIAIEGTMLFRAGRVEIRPEARRTLDGIISTLQGEYAGRDVFVLGHTDTQPIRKSGWKDNLQLSSERAMAVVRYLKERGIAPSRLIAGGCGSARPRTHSTSSANRAANRRVEIFALSDLPR